MAQTASTIRGTIVDSIEQELLKFLQSPVHNQYLEIDSRLAHVYTRKGLHMINGVVEQTLDIAVITVADSHRGRGIGGDIIRMMHHRNPFGITFVESLLNDSLYDYLKRNGWQDVARSNPPSVYLETGNECTMRPLRSSN